MVVTEKFHVGDAVGWKYNMLKLHEDMISYNESGAKIWLSAFGYPPDDSSSQSLTFDEDGKAQALFLRLRKINSLKLNVKSAEEKYMITINQLGDKLAGFEDMSTVYWDEVTVCKVGDKE